MAKRAAAPKSNATSHGPKTKAGTMEGKPRSRYVKGQGFNNTTPVGAPTRPQTAKIETPKPVTATSNAGSLVKGGIGLGVSHVKNNMAVPVLILLTFIVVAIAKIKATKGSTIASLDIPKALFGGFILTLMLMLLNMWNSKLATAFAALVFIGALLEFSGTLTNLIPAGKSAIDPTTGQLQTGLALDQTTPTGQPTSANIPAARGTQLA